MGSDKNRKNFFDQYYSKVSSYSEYEKRREYIILDNDKQNDVLLKYLLSAVTGGGISLTSALVIISPEFYGKISYIDSDFASMLVNNREELFTLIFLFAMNIYIVVARYKNENGLRAAILKSMLEKKQ
jgi:hypothetical protein